MTDTELSQNETSRVFRTAIAVIDSEFGEGYALRNPDLVAAIAKIESDFRLSANDLD